MSGPGAVMKVFKISHSGVVGAWRERERRLRASGVDVTMLSAAVWDEGGRPVPFEAHGDSFARPVTTWGKHPNVFAFDPRPIWRMFDAHWDVVDVHEEPCSLAAAEIMAIMLARRVKAPLVLYSAQNIAKRYPPPFRWIERWALRRAAAVSVCNAAAGRILGDKGLRGVAVEIPLGVDLDHFTADSRQPPRPGHLRVGYVGRLASHKGVDVLIESVGMAPGIVLEIAGSGPDETSLMKLAADLGIADRVNFVGSLTQTDLPEFYRSLDVVAVPSLTTDNWEEQFCRVAAEAMACGVPVVASRSGSLPEVIRDAGLLVEQGHAQGLRHAFDRLAGDPALWSKVREAGFVRSRDFTWDAIAATYNDLYERVSAAEASKPPEEAVPSPLEVVIVAYGKAELFERSLQVLGGRFPVTVVDNSSSAEIRAIAEHHGARYMDPASNLGFGAAVNRALAEKQPGGDVLLLNPDAEISEADVAHLQARLHSDPRLACVAPAQTDPRDSAPQRVGWPFPSPRRAWLEAVGLGRLNARTEFLIGSILLLRAEAIEDVGFFDERFFLYAEETDWQIRARRHGWRMLLCPEVRARHIGAGTGGDPTRRETHFHASAERLIRKHHGSKGWRSYRAANVSGALLRSLFLTGERRRAARLRLSLYWTGPCLAEQRLTRIKRDRG